MMSQLSFQDAVLGLYKIKHIEIQCEQYHKNILQITKPKY